ncbi:MAG: YpdA family putative bacillithiol disulfide reductase [Balneolaceae bacterium]
MVIIIGAGPIGIATGIQLQEKNIPFLIIEKGSLVHSLFHYPVNMTFFSTSDRLEIGNIPFISHGSKPTRKEALEYYRRVAEHFKLPIHLYEEVQSLSGADGDFTVTTNKDEYKAKKVVVATGFYGTANMMNVPGEELEKVQHYYKEPHPFAWQKVLVVGAGNSAVDVALECFRANAEVTMAVRGPSIKPTVKYWVKPDIENRIKFGEIQAHFNTTVKEIRPHEVVLNTPEGEVILENDFVLAMTGYHPNFELMGKLNIELSDDDRCMPIHEERTLETKKKGVYVAGVVCGGMDTTRLFIENTRVHANQIAVHIEKHWK